MTHGVEATEPRFRRGVFARPWLPLALGVFLALLIIVAGYDNSGREPPCFGDFPSQHPEAAEFRNGRTDWGQTCTAIASDGHMIAVKHYPGRWDWVAAGIALIAPLSVRGIWWRFRLRGVGLALLITVGAALAISEAEEQPEPLGGIAFRYGANLQRGQRVGRLAFPRFDKTVTVRAGFDQADVDRGPSWYPRGQLPGAGGTTYIAAHRLTHGGPFREIGDLRRGDTVILTTPYAIATYSVKRHALISERRTSILISGRRNELRLQASTIPAGHRRLVVFAQLETIERR